jgi:hypothetical protein
MAFVVEFETGELPPEVTSSIAAQVTLAGASTLDWTRRQGDQFHKAFMDQIAMSLENGESTQEATTRIIGGRIRGEQVPGIMKTTRRKAEALVRTNIAKVVNKAALQSFQDMGDICIAYSGLTWDVETLEPIGHNLQFNSGPPRHFNCRSRLVPVLKSFDELGIEATEVPLADRASMDGLVPGDITFDQFLRNKGKTFQNDLLGPGRAKLWREGRITLTQLVDFRGNPLTLDQLEKL